MKRAVIITAMVLVGSALQAQEYLPKPPRKLSLEFGVQVSNPEGEYAQAYSGYPVGFTVNLSKPLGRWSPFEIGADMSWNDMGGKRSRVPVYDGYGYAGEGRLKVRTTNQVYHGQLRFRPFNGWFKPYADGYVGAKAHQTIAHLTMKQGYEQETVYRDVLERDWTGSIGWGAGVQLRMGRHVNLDIRHQRLLGGGTEYVDRNSIEILDDGGVNYSVTPLKSSPLNTTSVGLTFTF